MLLRRERQREKATVGAAAFFCVTYERVNQAFMLIYVSIYVSRVLCQAYTCVHLRTLAYKLEVNALFEKSPKLLYLGLS